MTFTSTLPTGLHLNTFVLRHNENSISFMFIRPTLVTSQELRYFVIKLQILAV
jgi:hypothetical protein